MRWVFFSDGYMVVKEGYGCWCGWGDIALRCLFRLSYFFLFLFWVPSSSRPQLESERSEPSITSLRCREYGEQETIRMLSTRKHPKA